MIPVTPFSLFDSFRDVFDSKVEQQREVSREKREAELQELRERWDIEYNDIEQ